METEGVELSRKIGAVNPRLLGKVETIVILLVCCFRESAVLAELGRVIVMEKVLGHLNTCP